ncbi:MAG: hypothetical protein K2P30_05705 [Lachnospiraceae bacterium]|nr:hypothetical protein [Lachnospiraceae bacterium]
MDIKVAAPGIIGLVIFVIVFNVYHIIKIRKRKKNQSNAVREFQTNYKRNAKEKPAQTDEHIRFITKYNSSVDFVDKSTFISEAAEQVKNQSGEIGKIAKARSAKEKAKKDWFT